MSEITLNSNRWVCFWDEVRWCTKEAQDVVRLTLEDAQAKLVLLQTASAQEHEFVLLSTDWTLPHLIHCHLQLEWLHCPPDEFVSVSSGFSDLCSNGVVSSSVSTFVEWFNLCVLPTIDWVDNLLMTTCAVAYRAPHTPQLS